MLRVDAIPVEDGVAKQAVSDAAFLARGALMKKLLAGAANHSLRSQKHLARVRMLSWISLIAASTLCLVAVLIASAHLIGFGSAFIDPVVATGLVAAALAFFKPGRKIHVDLYELAERLDLDHRDHNAIATALDLICNEDRSELAGLAIKHGVGAATMFGQARPSTSPPTDRQRLNLSLLAGSLAAVGLACLIPKFSSGQRNASITVDQEMSRRLDRQTRQVKLPPPETPHAYETIKPILAASTSSGLIGTPHQAGAQSSSQSASQISNSSSGAAAIADRSASDPSAVAADSVTATAHTIRSANPSARDAGEPALRAATPLSSLLAKTDQSDTLSELGSTGAAHSGKSTASIAWSGGFGGAGSKLKSDQGAASSASTARGAGKPSKSGKSGGSSDQSGASLGGNGQAGGQSPPKKSRSVAPLMLGTLQPDLLQGKQLPGPDQHAELGAPPRARPESLAEPATVSKRPMPELPVDVFTVPWDAQRAVAQYFRDFHGDRTPQSVDGR